MISETQVCGSNTLLNLIFDNTEEALFVLDHKKRIILVNTIFCQMTGYNKEELIGRDPAFLQSEVHNESFFLDMTQTVLNYGRWNGEVWCTNQDNTVTARMVNIKALKNPVENPYYLVSLSDTSFLKQSEDRITFLSHFDVLTRLPNRSFFFERLTKIIRNCKKTDTMCALFFVDIDRFKNINDTIGHQTGDILLTETAKRFQLSLIEADTIARLGGDEFAIILPNATETKEIVSFANKLHSQFTQPYIIGGRPFFETCSIGISMYPNDGETVEELLKYAETAMYYAKEKGRNNFKFFSNEMNIKALDKLNMEMKLRQAIENNEFDLHLQPKINMLDNEISSFEALIRWHDKKGGIISPADFIPIAEESGLIRDIGNWVIQAACDQINKLRLVTKKDIPIAVNISPVQFENPDFVRNFLIILSENNIIPELIEIEVTEGVFLKDINGAVKILKELRDFGVKISIDDFGTGYSSLGYLKKLPIDKLKIDKSFISEVPHKIDSMAIVRSIINLGHNLGLEVIAEGVETIDQLNFLRENGCDEIQGFFYSKPLNPRQVHDYLNNNLMSSIA